MIKIDTTPQQPSQSPRKSKMASAAIRFFQGFNTADIYEFMYDEDDIKKVAASGMKVWDSALGGKNPYYLYDNEVTLIADHAREIARFIPENSLVIELGQGSEKAVRQKTIPLLESIQPKQYICADWSLPSVAAATELIKGRFPGMEAQGHGGDFLDLQSPIYQHNNATVMLFGSTIGNSYSADPIIAFNDTVEFLKKIKKLTGREGKFIVVQDTNQDEKSLLAAYNTKELHLFRASALWRLKSDLGIDGLDLDALKDNVIWNSNSHLVSSSFVNTKDQNFSIAGQDVFVPEGQRMTMANSYKYPIEKFLHMSKVAGFACEQSWQDPQGRMVLHVLKSV